METLCDNARIFSSSSPSVVIAGDLNLDVSRRADRNYYRGTLLHKLTTVMEDIGFELANDRTPTYRSHGAFVEGRTRRKSVLDLVLTLGICCPQVRVLPNTFTDHFPVLALLPMQKSSFKLKVLRLP